MSIKPILIQNSKGLLLIALFLLFSSFPIQNAHAQSSLIAAAPGGHSAIIAADFDLLRASPFYSPAMNWVMEHPVVGFQLRDLEEQIGIDLRKDISSFVMLTDLPPLSPAMLTDPLSLMGSGADDLASENGTMLIRGKFKASEVAKTLGDGESGPQIDGNRELVVVDPSTLAIVRGDGAYRSQMRDRLPGTSGPGEEFMAAISKLGDPQALYMMAIPKLEDKGSAKFAAFGARFGAEIQLSVLMTMADAESAQASAEELEALRATAGGNPLLSVFGVGPLVERLSIRHNERDVQVQTSATNAEVQIMLLNFMRVAATAQDLQQPLGGENIGQGTNGETPAVPGTRPQIPRDGVEADFN